MQLTCNKAKTDISGQQNLTQPANMPLTLSPQAVQGHPSMLLIYTKCSLATNNAVALPFGTSITDTRKYSTTGL